MNKVESVVSQLQAETQLLNSLSRTDHALKLLRGTEGSGRRSLSAAARERIAAAQRAREVEKSEEALASAGRRESNGYHEASSKEASA
jgi:hypothetical protein